MDMMRAYEFVTNTPIHLDDPKGYVVEDVALVRTSPPLLSPPIKGSTSEAMIERCVVVQRTQEGYGFTVTGESPFYVQTVRVDGPAYCAGVRQADRILKVNGMPVTAGNQQEVVRMISGGQNVVLTLLGKPPEPLPMFICPEVRSGHKVHSSDSISVDSSGKDEWKRRRKELLGQMLDEERRHVEGLRSSSENGDKLDRALKRIVTLQTQLKQVKEPQPIWNQSVRSMDADSDDEENEYTVPTEASGPFSNLADLKKHPAHLAVFINFLITSANPSSLFYYLITDAFQAGQGNAKEFRRWAFEIFTTFIIPNSPMVIPNSDQSIIQPIDKILATTAEHIIDSDIETLKRVFVPGRQRAVQDINEHLNAFREKRQLGLSSMFDSNQLAHLVRGDSAMENRVGEQMLFRSLENMVGSTSDLDTCELRTQAIIASLATVIRTILGKPSTSAWEKLMDRCPQFVQKERSGKAKKPPGNVKSKCQVKGHSFVMNSVNTVHYCYQCRDAIWGMQPFCYFCNNCDVKVHAQCTSSLTDACYPATQSKGKGKTRRSGLMGKSDAEEDEVRPEHNVKSTSSDSGIGADLHEKTTVGRSQSMRGRVATLPQFPEDRTPRRDRSTPSWGNDLPPADEEDEKRNRSIDGRSEISSRYYEGSRLAIDLQSNSGSSCVSQSSIPESEGRRMQESRRSAQPIIEIDSDMEVESETPPLVIDWDFMKHMKPKEKKRQDFINELFHTERTHVRNLKILQKVFYEPMKNNNVVAPEIIKLLFANLDKLVNLHVNMNIKMQQAVKQYQCDPNLKGSYGNIGPLMENMFAGEDGELLMQVTSSFCQHQQHALEILRAKLDSKKDKEDCLSRFLADAESHPICRKLQLKDMIPVEMQRLVKYPLLLEGIAKYTPEPSDEQDCLLRALSASKKSLMAVNSAKRNAENLRRLNELQLRMDTSPFDKEFVGHEHFSLNLTEYQLVHDGPLTCRFNRGKLIELHVILLETNLVLLTKNNDGNKLLLKAVEPCKETKWSPILPLAPLLAKEKANDKRAFFLVYQSQNGAQIFELAAATATERKTWFKLMSECIENDKKHQRTEGRCAIEMGAASSNDSDGTAKHVHVLTHPRLVNACEITVQQPTILEHAQPVLTPTERLKRSDEVIFRSLHEKHNILAQFLSGDKKGKPEELEKLTELLGGLGVADLKQRDSKELAMSAIVHGNRLLDSINNGMNAYREMDSSNTNTLVLDDADSSLPSVPCYKLTAIAAPLMNHLKALMQVVQDQKNELATVKQQLYHYKELAEAGPRDRSVSEETLTECSSDPPERKMMTKRQRTPSIQPLT